MVEYGFIAMACPLYLMIQVVFPNLQLGGKYFLNSNHTIKRFFAFAMLVLFTFSITPKRYLHDLFAGHTDIVNIENTGDETCIGKSTFNCDCNTLVATSPFIDDADESVIDFPKLYPPFFAAYTNPLLGTTYSFTELRGPPALG